MLRIDQVLGSRLESPFSEEIHRLEHRGAVDVVNIPVADLARRRLLATTRRGEELAVAFPCAWAQSSLAEIRFPQILPNPTWLNDWRNICRAGFPIHQAPRTSSFLGDVGPRPE